MNERDDIERQLRDLYADDDRTPRDDTRVDELHDRLADLAEAANECQAIGCREATDGWAFCQDHRLS